MITYKIKRHRNGGYKINEATEGETIEQKVERMVNNKEPIKDGAPMLYNERKDGVKASTNIRTDRWEIAAEAADKVTKSRITRREEKAKSAKTSTTEAAEPTQGKQETSTENK